MDSDHKFGLFSSPSPCLNTKTANGNIKKTKILILILIEPFRLTNPPKKSNLK